MNELIRRCVESNFGIIIEHSDITIFCNEDPKSSFTVKSVKEALDGLDHMIAITCGLI